ncbi:MAG: hypothetical protein HY919_07425 [Elusimicrobia bacterium]|nr:hypothetical protein [Elusimicrobiota bacterium]
MFDRIWKWFGFCFSQKGNKIMKKKIIFIGVVIYFAFNGLAKSAQITVEFYDISPPYVIQGDQNKSMVWIKMKTDVSTATWKSILIERIPVYQAAEQGAGGGSNKDVQYIKVYRDANLDGVLQVGDDPLISSGIDQFPADIVANSKLINLTEPQQINALSWKSYLIVYDVSPTALRDNTLGMKIASNAYIVPEPGGGDTVNAFPSFETEPAAIGPIKVSAIGSFDMMPVGLTQDRQYPLMSLDMKTNVNYVGWSGLLIEQTGDIQSDVVPPLKGDGALDQIGLYKDNGDLVYGSGDVFISSVTNGIVNFNNGVAQLYFSTQTITTIPAKYFIVGKIGRTDAEGNSTEGQTVGIKISAYSYFTINPYSAIASTENAFPYDSPKGIIRHYSKPSTPKIYVDEWIGTENKLSVAWDPAVSPDPANYPIVYYEYGVFTMPITLDEQIPNFTGAYQNVGLSTYVVASMPLPLDHGATYYFVLRSVNSIGIISLPGMASFRVDLTPTTAPGKPVPSTYLSGVPATQYTVNWGFSIDPESGVSAYEVQEKEDSSPVWKWYDVNGDGLTSNPSDPHTLSSDKIQGGITKLVVLGKKFGHFYAYRVRTQNRANSWSEWSDTSVFAPTSEVSDGLSQLSNFPNPFNPNSQTTTIAYVLKNSADVEIDIYDLIGDIVKRINIPAGTPGAISGPNGVSWDGKNGIGKTVDIGAYICVVKYGSTKLKTKIGVK